MTDAAPKPGPMLPVVALILSVVGLCLPPLLLITLGLGAFGLWRANRDAQWAPRKQVAQMTLAVSGAGLAIFLGLTLPHLKQVQARLRQAECKTTLGIVVTAQEEFYAREKRYATRWSELKVKINAGRALVRLAPLGPLTEVGLPIDEARFPALSSASIDDAVPQEIRSTLGLHSECPTCSITMLCATNLDADPTLDLWTLSTAERTGSNGEKIPARTPWNERDDLSQ